MSTHLTHSKDTVNRRAFYKSTDNEMVERIGKIMARNDGIEWNPEPAVEFNYNGQKLNSHRRPKKMKPEKEQLETKNAKR